MKKIYTLVALTVFLFGTNKSNAQTEWTGAPITITKESNADWTLEANQDRITSNVWITRKNNALIFNIVSETESNFDVSPADTEWALGSISDGVDMLAFGVFTDIVVDSEGDACPPCGLNIPMVMHLITDDIYIDFTLTSWNEETVAPPGDNPPGGFGNPGGQFTYVRSTDQATSVDESEDAEKIKLFPNPANDYISIDGLTKTENYRIYNILGAEINNGIIYNNEKISIQSLTSGMYFLKFEDRNTIKFIKE